MNPYPLKQISISYDGSPGRFPALGSLCAAERSKIESEVISVRQAAAKACGEDPGGFSSIQKLPTAEMVKIIKFGDKASQESGSFVQNARKWISSVVSGCRPATVAASSVSVSRAKNDPHADYQKAEQLVAEHGGDIDAAIAAALARFEATRGACSPGAVEPAKPVSQAGEAPARKESAVQMPIQAADKLTGKARAAAAFTQQFDDAKKTAEQKPSIRSERPELKGRALTVAAINSQIFSKPKSVVQMTEASAHSG